jgi:hypothetical protein
MESLFGVQFSPDYGSLTHDVISLAHQTPFIHRTFFQNANHGVRKAARAIMMRIGD